MYYFQAPPLYCTLIICKSARVQELALSVGGSWLGAIQTNFAKQIIIMRKRKKKISNLGSQIPRVNHGAKCQVTKIPLYLRWTRQRYRSGHSRKLRLPPSFSWALCRCWRHDPKKTNKALLILENQDKKQTRSICWLDQGLSISSHCCFEVSKKAHLTGRRREIMWCATCREAH